MKEVEELYGKMLAVFEEKTGFTMDDTADLAVRLYAAAAQIQSLYAYSDWAMNQSFPQTATGEYLDYHAARGNCGLFENQRRQLYACGAEPMPLRVRRCVQRGGNGRGEPGEGLVSGGDGDSGRLCGGENHH